MTLLLDPIVAIAPQTLSRIMTIADWDAPADTVSPERAALFAYLAAQPAEVLIDLASLVALSSSDTVDSDPALVVAHARAAATKVTAPANLISQLLLIEKLGQALRDGLARASAATLPPPLLH